MNTSEKNQIRNLFENYLSKRNCSDLSTIENENSRIDFTVKSASTTVIAEYKDRGSMPSFEYYTSALEVQKYDSMETIGKLFNAPALYICEYDDLILIFQIDFNKDYKRDTLPMQKSCTDSTKVLKPVLLLNNIEADYYINKRTWTTGTREQFRPYFENNFKGW